MSRPDIPRDVQEAATAAWKEARGVTIDPTGPISLAILAERDRCLRLIAEQRCERGTPWDLALVTAMNAIKPGSAVWEPKP